MKLKRFSLGELVTNCYVLYDEKMGKAAIFDAPDGMDKVLDYLDKNNLTVEYIFLTHAHFDHIGSLKELKDKTGGKIVVHRVENKYINDTELNLSSVPLPFVQADILTEEGDIFDFCGTKISVIHTPGHTEGGVCYYFDDTLISGDTLFLGSIGRFDFPLGNFTQIINSIKEKLLVLPDETKVYPGHGFSTTIGKERGGNPYLA